MLNKNILGIPKQNENFKILMLNFKNIMKHLRPEIQKIEMGQSFGKVEVSITLQNFDLAE